MASQELSYDVIVAGTGAAGFTAALTARKQGLSVLMVEKEPLYGGTSARSGGWLWIPCNPLAVRAGVTDTVEDARTYLRGETSNHFDPERVDAFLEQGPKMVAFLERETAAKFFLGREFPDYHPDRPGGVAGGRSIGTEPLDARELGRHVAQLRRPLPETTFLGMSIGSGTEIRHFFNVTRSVVSAAYVATILARYGRDVIRHRRGMRLTNGNALIARLAKSAFELGIELWVSSPVVELIKQQDGVVRGAIVRRDGKTVRVTARRGVVLATGGFSHDSKRTRLLYPHLGGQGSHHSPTASGATGDGLRLAETVRASLDAALASPAAWAPVSIVKRRDGSQGLFPHFVDRPKPGIIAVTNAGRRFVNEANSYHDFIVALLRVSTGAPEAYLVCDHAAIRRYGLGFAKPSPVPIGHHIRSGYLLRGRTIEDLAKQIGIEPAVLRQTVDDYNEPARRGEDPAFGKGSTAYNRFLGDPGHTPNPCLAPIDRGPFYAVKVLPADIGTYAGLRTDAHARVLDEDGQPIAGLYAAGNDAKSIMGGNYPGGGITLGPGMTFGYIAARHLAGAAV
ncbi:MAG: FAD-dependent oxidoreductase [Enterovirga sp.]|nr:FAD-dependent oxidoreductase [Enterovirga sp.]